MRVVRTAAHRATALVAVAAVTCTIVSAYANETGIPMLTTVADAADTTQVPDLVWGACPAAPEGFQVNARQACSTIRVPLDYSRAGGEEVTIAVSRIPAADQNMRRGVLVVNPGGPGSEGSNWPSVVAQQTSPSVLAAYDLIGFDPRGVGHSNPVSCDLTDDELLPPMPYPAADGSIDQNVADAKSVAQRCVARSGRLLPYITTANTARDLDRLRHALNEETVSYLGSSYGTYLGAVYASLFPRRADRFVLDSAVDPARVWHDQFASRSSGVADRFPDIARYAAAHADVTGFGSTPGAVKAAYLRLAAALDGKSVVIPGTSTNMTGNLLRYLTSALLAQPDDAFPMLAQTWRAVANLAVGQVSDDETALLRQLLAVASASAGVSPGVPKDNAIAAAYAVACDDTTWPRDIRTYARNVAEDRKAYPLTAGAPATIWPCAFWPTKPIELPVRIKDGRERTIMILQNERDPNTPIQTGEGMRKALRNSSVMITVDAGGHLAYGNQGAAMCATDAANAFLVSGKLPGRDIHCR